MAAAATHLFAGCAVSDAEAARPFYERLFGREPDLVPHAGEACWDLGGGLWVYFVVDAQRAGGGVLTVLVDDLDALIADWATRGIAPDDVRAEGPDARKARLHDPDGNELGFGQVG
jgi:catechol 2,3-dioxygenase-like lactoylglutathione lyase family enzyme